jgi:phosphatidylserine/phosphatidylglycerophosphate/cardiolipin synthase-like enzyme
MSDLSSLEKCKLEKILEMESGYVLDFTDRTFQEFILENAGININEDIEQITLAKFTIWVAVAWFTDRVLFKELVDKKNQRINVQLIIIDDRINEFSSLKYEENFEAFRIKKSGVYENLMHNKFCVIDLKTVVHGSYNWTNRAKFNNETIEVVSSREVAEKFSNQFIKIKQAIIKDC